MNKTSMKNWFKWLAGIASTIMLLAVSWAMIAGSLFIPKVPSMVTVGAGWVLFVLTLVGVVMALIMKVKKMM